MRFIPPPEENAVCYSGKLPVDYCSLQLPFADIHRTTGDFGTVISQQIKGNNFAIWKHDFFINRSVLLYPYVPEGIHTLNYMLKGNILCELVDFGKVELREKTYNLYYVPPVKQYAWLEAGEFSCLHIDLSPDYLQELATEFDPLKEFLKFSTAGNAKVVRATHYPMEWNIRQILKDIIQCKETGAARNMYFRSRIYNLLLIFSRDLKKEEHQASQVDDYILKQVQQYLLEYYHLPVTIDELCRRFGISKTALKDKYKAQFNITVHQFLTQKRMQVGLELLEKKIKICKVAVAVGYKDTPSFTKAFKTCYGSSPTTYMNRHEHD